MTRTVCVFNRTRESFLGLKVSQVRSLWARLLGRWHHGESEGVWLVPCRGLHTNAGITPVDLVYLDAKHKVVHTIEGLATFRLAPWRRDSASVLSLKPRTVYESRTAVGDELFIGQPEEIAKRCHDRVLARNSAEGNSLIELALVLPLLLVLLINLINFGTFLHAWITVANAARAGAEYSTLGTAVAGSLKVPEAAQVRALVLADLQSLPGGGGDRKVRVCTRWDTDVQCDGSGSWPVQVDPDGALYLASTIDVAYTYRPIVPVFTLAGETEIHRQAVMRVLQ